MIAALICVISIVAFLQFFVLYCRSIIASAVGVTVSVRVLELMGAASEAVGADDFSQLVQLVRLCPERHSDHNEIRAVGAYYGLLRFMRSSAPLFPPMAAWVERELSRCSHFAAVALDRRIAYSLNLYGQQLSEGL